MNPDTMNTIVTLIGSLGFPIACCIALFYFINKTMKELKASMDANTLMLTTLVNKLDGMG